MQRSEDEGIRHFKWTNIKTGSGFQSTYAFSILFTLSGQLLNKGMRSARFETSPAPSRFVHLNGNKNSKGAG